MSQAQQDTAAGVTESEEARHTLAQPDDRTGESVIAPFRLRRPGMPRKVLRRSRLDTRLAELFDDCGVVAVSAAPGSGKSVQAQLYAETVSMPVCWITLEPSHSSPRRMLSGLTEALDSQIDSGTTTSTQAVFRWDSTIKETAALVAGTIRPAPALLVIDECEHLETAADAQAALETFLEYIPQAVCVLLLSRTNLAGPLQRRMLDGRIRLLDDRELLLTEHEIEDLAVLLGRSTEESRRIHDVTGGWMAGACLSLRYGLNDQYPASEIPAAIMMDVLSQLPDDEQQFLMDSSVPSALTRDTAVALCGNAGHLLWESIRSRHLPATTTTDDTIVYHSLFREFLHRQLLARNPRRHEEVVHRYADYLLDHHLYEAATELYLSIDALDQASETAERAVALVCERSDWDTFIRWAERIGSDRLNTSPRLVAALVRSLFGQRRVDEAIAIIRTLDQQGKLRAAMEADKALLATASWALHSDPAEARRLLDRYEGDYRADVVRFMLEACTDLTPAVPPIGSDWGDMERIISWGLFIQGRFSELRKLAPTNPNESIVNPNVILAFIFTNDPGTARALFERVPEEIRFRPQTLFVEALILISEEKIELAMSALEVALSDSRRSAFYMLHAYEIFSGYVLFRLGRRDDAIAVLQMDIRKTAESGQTALLEWGQAFLGLTLLDEGRADEARQILNECVRSMQLAKRRLFLPFAAACLSEAESRCGDAHAAHEAANLAYHTATLTGSLTVLLIALRVFPEIAVREADEDPTGVRWRRLVIAPSARAVRQARATGNVHLGLQPFGAHRDISVDGVPQKIGRIKIIELMALLILHPDGIDRDQLQHALFPEATMRNGGNHFRQISFKFRQITGLSLDRSDGNLVGLPPDTVIEAADIRFEALVATASGATGEERVLRLQNALALVTGTYLGGSELVWAEDRRYHLTVVEEEARLELVRLLLDLGSPEQAREECESLLSLNRYSDPGYRLLVQIERTIGSETSVMGAYQRATLALEELGLKPGDARRLLTQAPPSPRRPHRQGALHDSDVSNPFDEFSR